jgi:membrane-bound serine protease (ClpP class)
MISVACNEVWMGPASAVGDCAPIMISPTGGMEELGGTERAKAESPILQEFRESAARNDYDQALCRAMVVMGAEVWWLENPATDERRFVDNAGKQKLIDDVPESDRQWKLVESYPNLASGKPIPLAQPIDQADTLLTMGQDEAVAFGFAKGLVRDAGELTAKLELTGLPIRYPASGWEVFAAWLNSPLIRGLLFMVVVVGAYMEFQHPGLILPGVTAAVALVIFLAAPYAAGLASAWTFVLLGIGLVLLGLEIFVIPGHGVSGVLGVALILVAVIGTFVPQEPAPGPGTAPFFSWPQLPGTWKALELGIEVLSGSVLVSIMGILLLIRYLPRTRLALGVVAPNPDAATLALADPNEFTIRVGDVGVVTGDLRPGGQARFGQDVVDVASQGEYVDAGRRVQVMKREGMRIVVRPLPNEQNV